MFFFHLFSLTQNNVLSIIMVGNLAPYYADCMDNVMSGKIKEPFDVQRPSYVGPCQINKHSVFLESSDEHSIVIDCLQFKSWNFRNKSLASCLRDQFPKAAVIRFKTTSYPKETYLVISFYTDFECNQALEKLFIIQNKKIHASKCLPKSSQIVYIDIAKIPIPYTDDVRDRSIEIFAKFGDILTMGKYVSADGHWFTGIGYVTFNIDRSKSFKELGIEEAIVYEFNAVLRLAYKTLRSDCVLCAKECYDHNYDRVGTLCTCRHLYKNFKEYI